MGNNAGKQGGEKDINVNRDSIISKSKDKGHIEISITEPDDPNYKVEELKLMDLVLQIKQNLNIQDVMNGFLDQGSYQILDQGVFNFHNILLMNHK